MTALSFMKFLDQISQKEAYIEGLAIGISPGRIKAVKSRVMGCSSFKLERWEAGV